MNKTFFISTSIPYVNADPHIGHALEFVEADVIARTQRLRGEDVFFLTGTDDNALKNVQAAEKAGISVKKWVDEHANTFKKLAQKLNISNDDFIRTSTEERHIKGAQKLWSACKKEDIYKKKYRGLYCVGCEEFKDAKELVNGECPEHPGKKLEQVEEENYFFKLSKYQNELEKLIESDKLSITPESRKHETLKFIKSGLEDFSISRSRERAKGWGVEVPGDKAQIMYVWFDALSNYINALGYAENGEKFKKYWHEGDKILHVIGKGINRFHTVYWPAMLLSAGIRVPTNIFIHGYITVDGQKISKSLGNTVDPLSLIDTYGVDALRYFLLRGISFAQDSDFTLERFKTMYTSDLANGVGNLVARITALGEKLGTIPISQNIKSFLERGPYFMDEYRTFKDIRIPIEYEFNFSERLGKLWIDIADLNQKINNDKPWEKTASDLSELIIHYVPTILTLANMFEVFLPETAKKIKSCIIVNDNSLEIKKGAPLFPRIDG